jgi:hypothetical protein
LEANLAVVLVERCATERLATERDLTRTDDGFSAATTFLDAGFFEGSLACAKGAHTMKLAIKNDNTPH